MESKTFIEANYTSITHAHTHIHTRTHTHTHTHTIGEKFFVAATFKGLWDIFFKKILKTVV